MPKFKKFRDLSRSQQNRRLKNFLNLNKDCRDPKISTPLKNNINLSTTINNNREEYQLVDVSEDYEEISYNDKESTIKSESLQNNLEQYNSNNCRQFINNNVYDDCEKCNKMSHAMNILREKISIWSVTYNLPQNSISALLRLFREAGMDGFPLDARTLLGTPRITKLSKTYSGEYFYYGLERALKQQLQLVSNSNIEQNLQLNLHVDGLPISKSSQSVLWPLLGQIAHSSCLRPFVIGIFHGYCKPSQPEEILNEFCAEYLHLKQNGFMYQQKKYTVTIRAVLCDAPARAFVTCTIGHNGFFACTKCEVEGDYDNNRMAFLKEDAQLRTDESFKYRTNPEHHKRQDKTPFEVISLSMVSQFPLDYMHLICLGIAKKILTLSIDGCKTVKFSTAVKNKLSEDLISVAEWIPLEFARRVRGLDDFCRWKATEHRTFLLYIGPIVLQRYLPEANMKHYNSLHSAIRILCDPIDYKYNNAYAYDLLLHFVQVFKVLYGPYNVSYNIHNAIHLPNDAMKFGPLDTFSCFPFENYLKDIKHLLRKGDKPLSQLGRRLDEMANLNVTKVEINSNDLFPLLLGPNKEQLPMDVSASHDGIKFKDFTLSCKRKSDCCCYLSDGSICSISYVGKKYNHPVILGITLEDPQPLLNYPCNSLDMKICCGNKWSKLKEFKAIEITNKAVRLFFRDMYFVAFSNDWCATVPVCWLNMKIKSLKWPPKNNNATIECKKASQPKENWNIIKYSRLLGPFGTYDEARAVEISAVDISTNDEEALVGIINNSQQLPKKRIVKKPARLHSFSDEDDNDDEPILKNSVKKNVVPVIPDPPKSYKPHIINDRKIEASTGAEKRDLTKSSDHKKIGNAQKDNMKQNNDNNNDFCNESFVYDDQPLDYGDYLSDYSLEPIEEISEIETTVKPVHEHTDENLKPQKHVNMKKNITLQLKNTDTHRLQYNQNLSILPDKPKIRSVVNTNIPIRIATCTAKKEQEETLQFQDDSDSSKQIPTTDNNENESSTYQHHTFCCKACRHNMQVILHKINAIDMHFVDLNGNEPQRNDGNTLPQFPIVTVQELENFNKLLKEDATARAQYKKMIKNIGGKDVKKHVRQALTLILNDEFSCKLSWTGQKKTIKVKDMKFVDIMIESMINSGRNSTIFDVQDTIQKWLQHASDRVRYTEKKHAQT